MNVIVLSGCMLPGGGGYGSMFNPIAGTGMGGSSYLGATLDNSNGTTAALKNAKDYWMGFMSSPGHGGISGANASEFAQNVIALKVGKSSREDAIQLLGTPATKNSFSGGEMWMYLLRSESGDIPGSGYIVFNSSGIIKAIKISKYLMSGGSVNSEEVYSRGSFNNGSF